MIIKLNEIKINEPFNKSTQRVNTIYMINQLTQLTQLT